MKKVMIALLGAVLLLAGCGENEEVPSRFVDPAVASQAPSSVAEEPQAAPASVPAPASSTPVSEPAGSAAASSAPTGASAPAHGNVELPANDGEIVEISERLFIAQTNDIYLNFNDYLGRTIKYEGMYKNTGEWDDGGEIIHFVIRYGPGCCGYDGEAGFEVRWDGEYPQIDDWVEVIGTIEEEIYESGFKVLYVDVTSLTVKEERGAEYVAT